jgi:hypothetical protein
MVSTKWWGWTGAALAPVSNGRRQGEAGFSLYDMINTPGPGYSGAPEAGVRRVLANGRVALACTGVDAR